jgi:hypothetical protein
MRLKKTPIPRASTALSTGLCIDPIEQVSNMQNVQIYCLRLAASQRQLTQIGLCSPQHEPDRGTLLCVLQPLTPGYLRKAITANLTLL